MTTTYPAEGSVSIWVGTFSSEDAFDRAADRDVEIRLKLPISLAAIAEVAFEEAPVATAKLLEGFSGCETFIEEASAVSEQKAPTANAALACYHLCCSAEPGAWGELIFLGSFGGSDDK